MYDLCDPDSFGPAYSTVCSTAGGQKSELWIAYRSNVYIHAYTYREIYIFVYISIHIYHINLCIMGPTPCAEQDLQQQEATQGSITLCDGGECNTFNSESMHIGRCSLHHLYRMWHALPHRSHTMTQAHDTETTGKLTSVAWMQL